MNATETKPATHTPGPWRVEDWQYPQTGREHVATIQNDSDAIAEVLDLWCMDDRAEEKAANARLIAAAPALLAALESIAGHTSNAIARNHSERPTTLLDLHSTVISAQITAREAIAKATQG